MVDGVPIPDFGPDSDDFLAFGPHTLSNLHSLTADDLVALRSDFGLILAEGTPLRCTANSTVYQAQSEADGHPWALKVTRHKRRVLEEYEKRRNLPMCRFLVKTIRCFEIHTKALLQMEVCSQSDIAFRQFDEPDCWQLVSDVGSALAVIHRGGWMHLDVSPVNILRTDFEFKLADFGTLTQVGDFAEGKEGAGPYVSPEALGYPAGRWGVDQMTDIFSFGLVLLEAAAGRRAPRGGSGAYQRIRRGEISLGSDAYPVDCSQDLKDLVTAMLAVDPGQRPTAEDLVAVAADRCLIM
jgi:membrane-associated tyrosine/threonine-specific cdc2-inhibitory kinase